MPLPEVLITAHGIYLFQYDCLLHELLITHGSELLFGQASVVSLPWSSQRKTIAFIAGDYSENLNSSMGLVLKA